MLRRAGVNQEQLEDLVEKWCGVPPSRLPVGVSISNFLYYHSILFSTSIAPWFVARSTLSYANSPKTVMLKWLFISLCSRLAWALGTKDPKPPCP